ncbi:MAG: iron-containing alcohol dehydrogenase, partial [Anaerolineales bacterium]|nr:iron-containing alcohol dehydrogenase [Anaerolineales bacterium]
MRYGVLRQKFRRHAKTAVSPYNLAITSHPRAAARPAPRSPPKESHMQLANSTYLWPGETHFGFDTAVSLPILARGRGANALFLIADPGVVQAGVADAVCAALDAAMLPYTLYTDVVPNPDV